MGVFWVGAKKFMLKEFMCLFGPLIMGSVLGGFCLWKSGETALLPAVPLVSPALVGDYDLSSSAERTWQGEEPSTRSSA